MQHEVTTKQKLLDEKGLIKEPGWARSLVWDYSRDDIHAAKNRIKEWDYYLVGNGERAVAFTISDLGYMGMISMSFLNIKEGWEKTKTITYPFSMGKLHLGTHSDNGNAIYQNKKFRLEYKTEPGKRIISLNYPKFDGKKDFICDITLQQDEMESMVIATPWKKKPTAFYYNQKIATMPATGKIIFGDIEWDLDPNKDFGCLDWGRGVWTYKNVWYWAIGSGKLNDKPFGFNLGYGFSDRSSASENVIYYDHKVHKLEDVTFEIPKNGKGKFDYDYLKPWTITSSDKRFEATLTPQLDRHANINILLISSKQHQIFGKLNGKCILDDGTVLEMNDFPIAIEVIRNRY